MDDFWAFNIVDFLCFYGGDWIVTRRARNNGVWDKIMGNLLCIWLWAIPHKERLSTLHAICLQISRHILQKCSWIHPVFTPLFVSSDEKFDDVSVAQSLCGIAYDFSCCYTLKTLMDTGSESILLEILGCRVCIFQENAVFPWWSPSKKVE